MKLHLRKGLSSNAGTLVVFATKDSSGKPTSTKISEGLRRLVEAAYADGAFSGDKKEAVFFRGAKVDNGDHVLLVGLGEAKKVDYESIRHAGALTYAALKNHRVRSASILMEGVLATVDRGHLALQALAEGVLLSDYEFDELKSKPKDKKDKKPKPKLEEITFSCNQNPSAEMQRSLERAEILSKWQKFARWLGDQPGNYMTPTRLAEEAAKAGRSVGVKVEIWDKSRIKREKMGGLMAVSAGSSEDPRFIIMHYRGGPKSQKPICFVGKGLTFDSGGISIKPSANMEEMKYDMCGGASVIATIMALAELEANVNAIGLVASTENMPGPSALKPGDVFVARNGKSVEVFNTDAEGRLILADALSYGSELKPEVMVDAATLTGAILIALGNTHTGVFTRDQKLMQKIQKAADHTGELVWPMPLTDFHRDDIKGTHADLCNISPGRLAGSATAAAFLEEFVEPGIAWAHFDIAGTAWNVNSRFPYCPKKSASGIMVRTFVRLAETYFQSKDSN